MRGSARDGPIMSEQEGEWGGGDAHTVALPTGLGLVGKLGNITSQQYLS